jgi:sporulation-control protein spo0M
MNERIIRWIVPIIPTLLLVSCVVAAFATNGWDAKATFFAEDPGNRIAAEIEINSPVNVSVTVEELSVDVGAGDITSTIALSEPVTIPAKGSASLNLEGALPTMMTSDPQDLQALMSSGNPEIRGINMKLDVAGIKLEIKETGDTTGGNI